MTTLLNGFNISYIRKPLSKVERPLTWITQVDAVPTALQCANGFENKLLRTVQVIYGCLSRRGEGKIYQSRRMIWATFQNLCSQKDFYRLPSHKQFLW